MAPLLYTVAVLCVFLTSNTVSGFTLPEFAIQQKSNVSPNEIGNSLARKDVITDGTEEIEGAVNAESSDAVSVTITISSDQIPTATSIQPAPSTSLSNSITLEASTRTTIVYPTPTSALPDTSTFGISTRNTSVIFPTSTTAVSENPASPPSSPKYSSPTYLSSSQSSVSLTSAVYTPPSQPFTVQNGSRRHPTNTITLFATPTFVNSQTLTLTETIATIFVINPTQTSTILSTHVITTVSTSTITGYDCKSTNAAPTSASKVILSGINLSGFETGCDTTGTCNLDYFQSPMSSSYNLTGQISHFTEDGFNTFRLPVSWQYLTNNVRTTTGVLNPTNFAAYDQLVQTCLNTGAYCVIDLHNYGRFNDYVIGQGGATDTAFVALWSALATKYALEPYVIFGLMNEISYGTSYAINGYGQSVAVTWNINTWATTLQAAVNAIRAAGATSQFILLRGSDWTGTTSFVSATADALATIINTGGQIGKLIFDFQKYLDYGTGRSAECVSSYITQAFAPAAQWLRCHGRQALLTEIGGGDTNSCLTYMCPVVDYLNANSDVFVGYIGWAAGTLSSTLSLTPEYFNNTWLDKPLVQNCLKPTK